MNKIVLSKIEISGNKIDYYFSITGDISKYYNDNHYSIEYSTNIESVPLSILTVPFVGNFLPTAFVFDVQIEVDHLDKSFYDSINEIRNGYKFMHPKVDFKGCVHAKVIESNNRTIKGKCGLFFSCGVDSTTTLFRHIDEKPDLFSIGGSDLYDFEEWDKVESRIKEIADEYSLIPYFARSTFKKINNNLLLDNYVSKFSESWWHGFHHGVAIITHIAPIAYINGYEYAYISSTFDESLIGKYTCASDPLIDNNIHYANCRTIHDGYELTRQDKIKLIIDFNSKDKNKKKDLRVCYYGKVKNCCACEKCYCTALSIVSEGADPNDYGFVWGDEQIKRCEHDLKNNIILDQFKVNAYYKPLQLAFKNNNIADNRYEWFKNFNLDNFNKAPKKIIFSILRNIKHKVFKL